MKSTMTVFTFCCDYKFEKLSLKVYLSSLVELIVKRTPSCLSNVISKPIKWNVTYYRNLTDSGCKM